MRALVVVRTLPEYFKCFLHWEERWIARSDLKTGSKGYLQKQVVA